MMVLNKKVLVGFIVLIFPIVIAAYTVTMQQSTCASGEVLYGINPDGSLNCVSDTLIKIKQSSGIGAFTYNGEGAGSCTGDICRGGTCSGTTPNGTCTLSLNTIADHPLFNGSGGNIGQQNPGSNSMAVYYYTSFSLSGGTLTIDNPVAQGHGAGLALHVNGDVTITGGKIDLKGKGAQSMDFAPDPCKSSTAGKIGCSTYVFRGATGSNTGDPGSNGQSAAAFNDYFHALGAAMLPFPHTGGCGGHGPSNNTNVGIGFIYLSYGAAGGGSGGCAASCSGNIEEAGDGGGYLRIISGGTYSCTGGTIDVSGTNGGAVAGGGGGGIGLIFAKTIGTNTCTIVASGGTGGAAITNCGAGGNGGNGYVATYQIP